MPFIASTAARRGLAGASDFGRHGCRWRLEDAATDGENSLINVHPGAHGVNSNHGSQINIDFYGGAVNNCSAFFCPPRALRSMNNERFLIHRFAQIDTDFYRLTTRECLRQRGSPGAAGLQPKRLIHRLLRLTQIFYAAYLRREGKQTVFTSSLICVI